MDNIKIIRSSRSTIGIQVMADTSIKVTAPYLVPRFMINKLLKEKEAWIKKQQQIMRDRNLLTSPNMYFYLGKQYSLAVRIKQKNIVELSDKLYVASSSEKYIKTYLESWYKQQARKIIFERVHHYSRLSGLKFNSINLTSATTRWGSCSSQKSLNFNWKLVMAPLPVIDYVVCHELAHLVELNHSRDFWETVRKMFPIYRQFRTWLKRYGHTLTI